MASMCRKYHIYVGVNSEGVARLCHVVRCAPPLCCGGGRFVAVGSAPVGTLRRGGLGYAVLCCTAPRLGGCSMRW